jgi:hypothetical protein
VTLDVTASRIPSMASPCWPKTPTGPFANTDLRWHSPAAQVYATCALLDSAFDS